MNYPLCHANQMDSEKTTRLFQLNMVYFVVANNVEEINNEIKTRKCASDMKRPKNVDVLTKTAKRNAL